MKATAVHANPTNYIRPTGDAPLYMNGNPKNVA